MKKKRTVGIYALGRACIVAGSLFLAVGMVAGLGARQISAAQESQAFEPFIRIDRDDPEAYERELENLRIITEGEYELSKPKEKYGIDPDYTPDLTGLDTLQASASAQFNEWQFRELAETLREVAQGKEIYVFDLRRESHVLLDGRPFFLVWSA